MKPFSKKPLILTRPKADNGEFMKYFRRTAARYQFSQPFVEMPLMRVFYKEYNMELPDVDCVVFTSRHGVKGFQASTKVKHKFAFCVGESTANIAKQSGFKNIFHPSSGNFLGLVDLIKKKIKNKKPTILYIRGQDIAFDLKNEMDRFGYLVIERIVYEQKLMLVPEIEKVRIQTGHFSGVLLFSAKAAFGFCKEIGKFPEDFLFFCISDRVADRVRKANISGKYKIKVPLEPKMKDIVESIISENI